jgi:hypothetical protein
MFVFADKHRLPTFALLIKNIVTSLFIIYTVSNIICGFDVKKKNSPDVLILCFFYVLSNVQSRWDWY